VLQIPQLLGKLLNLKAVSLVQLALGHIPPHIQQLPDALGGLLIIDKGCGGSEYGISRGDTDSAFIKPN